MCDRPIPVAKGISEPKLWHGDGAARRAVTNNRTRLLSGVAKEAFKLRAEIVERSFAHNLDRGGMRLLRLGDGQVPEAAQASLRGIP